MARHWPLVILMNSIALYPWVWGISAWLVPTYQHCLWITVRLMIYTWSWWDPPKGSSIGAGFLARLCLCGQVGIRKLSRDSILGSLVSRCSMHKSIVPSLRENMQPCVALQREDNGSSCLASPFPLLWGSLWLRRRFWSKWGCYIAPFSCKELLDV